MKNDVWSKRAAHLWKGYKISRGCAFAIICSMITLVFIAELSGHPLDQQGLAMDFAPLIFLFVGIAAVCHLGHSLVKPKVKQSNY
ncbi:hypothetical protein [Pseudomonas sp. JBR1]|uniref:hypothetical protein n=1 Tax=Pseudomonas sp. JBR1 TaxID=3020907 RepID=UPI002305F6FE|nr:hypothetical protein [Pseudomonas sp. JBR1]WCE10193.1 hypothetical protein PJ259_08110 [Pseudomonas sp. JBR1]